MNQRSNTHVPTGMTPEPMTAGEKRKKMTAGRVAIFLIAFFAAVSFAVYIILMIYGSAASAN